MRPRAPAPIDIQRSRPIARLPGQEALARDAGVNMLRVGGTMVYESDLFYRLCDELGILVWQDFMFANMDYPVDDPSFSMSIHAEARHQLTRLASHPCVVAYCDKISQSLSVRPSVSISMTPPPMLAAGSADMDDVELS
mgnify:CR=1 FL=1